MNYKEKYNYLISVILGCFISTLIFFMIEVLYAQILLDFVIDQLSNSAYVNVLIIFIGGELIALVVSILVSFIVSTALKNFPASKKQILYSCGLAFIVNLILWFSVSFLSLLWIYPEIFQNVIGFEIIVFSPLLVMYFGVYILGNIILVWVFSQFTYFFLFGLFLQLLSNKRTKSHKRGYRF